MTALLEPEPVATTTAAPPLPHTEPQVMPNVPPLPPYVPGPNPNGAFTPENIYYELHGDASKPRLILIHGFGMGIEGQVLMLQELAPHFHLLVPELRSHGRSAGAARARSIAQLAQDVLAIADHLQWHTYNISGYSMGGAVAQELALQAPHRVLKLQIGGTFACKRIRWHEKLAAPFAAPAVWLAGPPMLAKLLHPAFSRGSSVDSATLHRIRRVMRYQHRRGLADSMRSLVRWDGRPRLPKLAERPIPVLILHGNRDSLVQPWHARRLAQFIPHAQLEWCSGAGHPMVYTHTGWMAQHMRRFFNGN